MMDYGSLLKPVNETFNMDGRMFHGCVTTKLVAARRMRDYIHLRPPKHGYVVRGEDWPWSSLHRHIRLGWLGASWPGSTPIEMPDTPGE